MNAEIITAELARADIVEGIAFDEAYALLSEAEKTVEFDIERINDPSRTYPQFGGVTFSEYLSKREAEIARDTIPPVQCGYQVHLGYRGGIGLKIVVAEPVLTREIIDNSIRSFLKGAMPKIRAH